MMIAATLAALMCGWVQEDPAVTYREGLYEEVDQGRLDRAVEIYAKVLKGGAPAALKAKALFRQGLCFEKLGKRKEAEQAYRDVAERFAAESETAKLAQERLAGLDAKNGPPRATFEQQVERSILDLGSDNENVRHPAIRTLTLIGSTCLPELRRAVSHKDMRLSLGAAAVLVELEQYDGLYEVLLKGLQRPDFFLMDGDVNAVGKFFQARPDDRRRLVKDFDTVEDDRLEQVVQRLAEMTDPDFLDAFEGRLMDRLGKRRWLALTAECWVRKADPKRIFKLLERALVVEGAREWMLQDRRVREMAGQPEGKRMSEILLKWMSSLESPPTGMKGGYSLHDYLPYVPVKDFLEGPFSVWLRSKDEQVRDLALQLTGDRMWQAKSGWGYPWPPGWRPGLVDFGFEALASDQYSREVKRFLLNQLWKRDTTPAQREKLAKFYLQCLAELDPAKESDQAVVVSAVYFLSRFLPADSADLPRVLAVAFAWCDEFEEWRILTEDRPELRKVVVQEALRAVESRDTKTVYRALGWIRRAGTTEDKLRQGHLILAAGDQRCHEQSIEIYFHGFSRTEGAARASELKAIAEWYKSGSANLRHLLASRLLGQRDAEVQEIMKDAQKDKEARTRMKAVQHWGILKREEATPRLLEALRDPDPGVLSTAISSLAAIAALDAVPHLIELLQSKDEGIRAAARSALEAIKKHYEEQEQWRRWYDELKGEKDKK